MLEQAEYIELAYFYQAFRERLENNQAAQEILASLKEEALSSTRMPMAIEFLLGELLSSGRFHEGMARLSHYFPPFHAFVMKCAEEDASKFDMLTALEILQKESSYRAKDKPLPQGLFIFQFECVMRNRLGYLDGIEAISRDSFYNAQWKEWFGKIKKLLGTVDFADLVYARSQFAVEVERKSRNDPEFELNVPVLFGLHEGRIARANHGKEPLYLFSALQRHLDYPRVPRKSHESTSSIPPMIESRFNTIESRIKLMEMEIKGQVDLSQFYVKPEASQTIKFNDDGPQ
jgi:hypothetical protein